MPLTGVEQRLMAGLAAQAGLVLRLAALRAELEARHAELVSRAGDLRASRDRAHRRPRRRAPSSRAGPPRRGPAAPGRSDGEPQARPDDLRPLTGARRRPAEREQGDAARVAIDTLTSLSRGIYPPLLGAEGLVPALRSAAATSSIPVTVDTTTTERPPTAVEAALYFCCMESVQNAAKHSGAALRVGAARRPGRPVAPLRRRSRGRFRLAGRRSHRGLASGWSTCATGSTRSAAP